MISIFQLKYEESLHILQLSEGLQTLQSVDVFFPHRELISATEKMLKKVHFKPIFLKILYILVNVLN